MSAKSDTERGRREKKCLKAFIESARPGEAKNLEEGQLNQLFDLMQSSGETIKSGGLPVFFCPPFATNMANFTGWSHEAIDLQPWSSPDFEGLVESIVVQLAGKKKSLCIGRAFYNNTDPKLATKIFVQPGFVKVPKPIQPGILNFLVAKWVPCLTHCNSEGGVTSDPRRASAAPNSEFPYART